MNPSKCKSQRCGATIVWCDTVNGRKMPLDEQPSADGKWRIEDEDKAVPTAIYVPAAERLGRDDLHESHWATCIDAASFKTKGASG